MNATLIVQNEWAKEIQFGNLGAALFILTYIGFYGLGIICLFAQQLKETQRQRYELPAYFLKTLWDVPNKNKLYEELADVERLKRIFRGYFADHESYMAMNDDDLQVIVDERAHACATKYRQKLRLLHLSHTDYYADTVERLFVDVNDTQKQLSKSITLIHTTVRNTVIDREDNNEHILTISVV